MFTLLKVNGLRTYYFMPNSVIKAVDGVSFELEDKEALGLAGESGCGKSTIGQSIIILVPPPGKIVKGEIIFDGQDLRKKSESEIRKIRWKRISIVFQEAMNEFNPVMKIEDQIIESISAHSNLTKSEASIRARKLFELMGLEPSRVNNYPHEFSGGMKQRAAIAMALSCDPEIIICDEPSTALDVIVQAHILNLLTSLKDKLGLSMILITHDLSIVAQTCDNIAITYAGKIVELTDVKTFFKKPMHPYSQGLLRSFPSLKGPKSALEPISGFPPDLINPPSGCRFHPRCIYAMPVCRREEPEMMGENKQYVACHLFR